MISRGGAGLFMEPGLGKTSVVLAAFKILKDKGMVKRMLVIAPRRVMRMVWPDEISKWSQFENLNFAILHGNDKDVLSTMDADIYIINPEGLRWFMTSGAYERVKADVLCVDELSKFKHSRTERFKLLKHKLNDFRWRWGLTGSPVANGMMGLFGQCYVLDQGAALGRYITHFRNKYFYQRPHDTFGYYLKDDAEERIREAIQPIALSMQAEDYLELPELVNQEVLVTLPPTARTVYKSLEDNFLAELEGGDIAAMSAAAVGMKLRQICNGAVYDEHGETHHIHDEKLEALLDIMEELDGAPALVLYEFNHDKERLLKQFGEGTPVLGGGISDAKADMYCAAFNAGTIPMLLAHPASAGHGLNLQRSANHIIWFGLPWDLELYDQSIRRIRRQGNQHSHVFVHHILASGTLDQRILRVLTDKDVTQKSFMSALRAELLPGIPASSSSSLHQAGEE